MVVIYQISEVMEGALLDLQDITEEENMLLFLFKIIKI